MTPEVVTHSLEKRVGHLEESVDSLHKDSIRTQSAIASIATHIDSIVDTMHVIDQKLDEQRTRRPELAGIAAVAAVILTFMGYSGWIINDKIQATDDEVAHLEVEVDSRGKTIGYYEGVLEEQRRALDKLENRVDRLHDE